MSPAAQLLADQINQVVRTYPKEAFDNMRLNAILLRLLQIADATGSGTGTGTGIVFTSGDFINNTDCPLGTGDVQLMVFFNEIQRYLNFDQGEYIYLPGGGIKVQLPGFNKNNDNYHFYATIL